MLCYATPELVQEARPKLHIEAVVGKVDGHRYRFTFVGIPGLMPLPWWQTLAIFAYAMGTCLAVNDTLKVAMIKWRVPSASA